MCFAHSDLKISPPRSLCATYSEQVYRFGRQLGSHESAIIEATEEAGIQTITEYGEAAFMAQN